MNRFALLLAAAVAGSPALARDDHKLFPIEDALAAPAAKDKLDKDVKLFFGSRKHPKVAKTYGEWKTSKKTNAFNKTDKAACEWAFLSAVLELQERARMEGGNAVINIKSNYKGQETDSATEYMCGSGAVVAGVAFKGTVVKLGGK